RSAVDVARRALGEAREALTRAQGDVLTPLPAGEVVYLSSTPRRVDTVDVRRGSTLGGGPVMTVSGATLQVSGTVSDADADLLTPDLPAVVVLPDGTEVAGRVAAVGAGAARASD